MCAGFGLLDEFRGCKKCANNNNNDYNKIIKFYQQVGKECTKTGQQADAKEANNFGEKYGNGEIITEKPNR